VTTEPEVEYSERGFKQLKPIVTEAYEHVRLSESSRAFDPSIWLWAKEPVDRNVGAIYAITEGRSPEPEMSHEVGIHLTAADAAKLRDQLDWMLRHHSYGDVRPEVRPEEGWWWEQMDEDDGCPNDD
jgi:hypothetical protein